jgi:ribosomal protein L11 methyltransferase
VPIELGAPDTVALPRWRPPVRLFHWHEPPVQAKQLIRLDPGFTLAPGHPTTRMCLKWIAGRGQSGAAWAYSTMAVVRHSMTGGRSASRRCGRHRPRCGDRNTERRQPCCVERGSSDHQRAHDAVFINIPANPLQALAPLLRPTWWGGIIRCWRASLCQADELKAPHAS